MNNIILIGFMGCGKSSVGVRLSYELRIPLLDTDKEIERQRKAAVSEIFEKYGEEAFRNMETECLIGLLKDKDEKIISVGGGLPLRSENRALLKELGRVFYLRVSAETVCKRLAGDTTRPLLQGENPKEKVRELLGKRSSIYEAAADVIIDADDKGFDELISEITGKLEERK